MSRWPWLSRLLEDLHQRLASVRGRLRALPRPNLSRLNLQRFNLPGGARLWVSLASAGFLLAALAGNVQQLLQLSLDGQGWLWLLLGVGLSLLSLVVNGLAWGACLRWLGHRPRWAAVVRLFLASNLRKYLPGGVWHLLARLRALRAEAGAGKGRVVTPALSTPQALVAVLLDPLLMAVAALALVPLGGWQAGLGLLCPLALLLLLPHWLNPLMERLERQRARQLAARGLLDEQGAEQPAGSLQLPGYPWPPLLAELGFVLLRFAGFACCVQAFDLSFALGWGGWLAGFGLAWTAGLVIPGAPGGLGVFEAVLILRLAFAVPEAPLLAVAISYRLITALADLIAAGTAQLDQPRDAA
ncbi:MAG: lysylphosphatidylglycerol synthase domain-containing protein [Vulcanococcus sp.]